MSQPDPIRNDSQPIWDSVIVDMQNRDRVGRERYGVPLQAGNGRDALQDAYEEALDMCVYLKQAIVERDATKEDGSRMRAIIDGLTARVAAQSELLSKKAEVIRCDRCG